MGPSPPFFMPEIVVKLPTFCNGEINKALEREIRLGLELKKATEQRREIEAAAQAQELKRIAQESGKKDVKGLGRCVAVIPSWDWFRMKQKYGHAETHSREFLSYYQKKFPHLAPNKI
jgi:hypothetical protein